MDSLPLVLLGSPGRRKVVPYRPAQQPMLCVSFLHPARMTLWTLPAMCQGAVVRIEHLVDEEEGTEVRTAHWISTCEARTLRGRTKTATAVVAAQLLPSYRHHRGRHRRKMTSPPLAHVGAVESVMGIASV